MAGLSIKERIAAQTEAPRDSRDVDVTLDASIRAEVEALEEKIEALENEIEDLEEELEDLRKDPRLSDARPREIEARIEEIRASLDTLEQQRADLQKGSLVTIRFLKMDGADWAEIGSRHPARLDVSIDRLSGYNYHETAREAAPRSGYEVRKDGEEETLEPISPEDWAALFQVLSGREIEWISSTLWDLNDFGPRKKVDAARKALSDGSASRSS